MVAHAIPLFLRQEDDLIAYSGLRTPHVELMVPQPDFSPFTGRSG